MKVTKENVVNAIIREQISHRGGGVEIDLSQFGFPKGALMSAYQNYLGVVCWEQSKAITI